MSILDKLLETDLKRKPMRSNGCLKSWESHFWSPVSRWGMNR